MQVVALLSDLKSLSACSPEAAALLTSVHKLSPEDISQITESKTIPPSFTAKAAAELEPDVKRAHELIDLHYNVKQRHLETGLDPDLEMARTRVNRVVESLQKT